MHNAYSCVALTRLLERHGFALAELVSPAQAQERWFRRSGLRTFEHVQYAHGAFLP